jgi:hypothetical protein
MATPAPPPITAPAAALAQMHLVLLDILAQPDTSKTKIKNEICVVVFMVYLPLK